MRRGGRGAGWSRGYGEPAPGPPELRLRAPAAGRRRWPRCPTTPSTRSASSSAAPSTIRRATARAAWLEAIVDLPIEEAYARMTALPGIGPWTAAEVAVRALGDPDAVSVGDFHLPNLVAFALAGEPRADDARMLELLEPWRGERARVIRLLELSGHVRRRSTARGCRRVASSATDRTLVASPREERRTTSTATDPNASAAAGAAVATPFTRASRLARFHDLLRERIVVHRRRDGDAHPELRAGRGRLSRRAVRRPPRATCAATATCCRWSARTSCWRSTARTWTPAPTSSRRTPSRRPASPRPTTA